MDEKDLNGILDDENSEMEQVTFELDQSPPEMEQIEFKLDETSSEVEQVDAETEQTDSECEQEVLSSAQEMTAEELDEFVNELETSVNELGEFVEEMNEIVSDEANSDSQELDREQEQARGQAMQKTILSYLHDIAFGMVAILLIFMIVFRVVVVSGPSMQQTLQHGDCLVLLNSVFYREPKVGDIVVATKTSYKDGEPIIKRVIATEGQVVDIDFEQGIVYVDGVALHEPYTNTPTNLYEGVTFPLTVKEDCVFVMGDNRNDSKDSRSVEIGQIDRRELLGKALFLVIPGVSEDSGEREFDRIGALW